MTQAEMAAKIGATRDQVYTYEAGKAKPNSLLLRRIAEIAKISVDQLLSEDLTKKDIQVLNPDTKQVEYTLTNTTNSNGTSEKEQELSKRVIELETEVKTLKEFIEKLIEKR